MRIILLGTVVAALASCEGLVGEATFADVTEDPADHDGERVTFEAGYYGAFEMSVLTSGFTESFPPQPVEPLIWVGASPPNDCLEEAQEEAEGVSWAERVEASGTFLYEPDGGFGHLGAYEMALDVERITCL